MPVGTRYLPPCELLRPYQRIVPGDAGLAVGPPDCSGCRLSRVNSLRGARLLGRAHLGHLRIIGLDCGAINITDVRHNAATIFNVQFADIGAQG